ncbi:unnamed protein product [Gongylonema pulchrum]|uniref:IQ calmodulin-binding motif domain-containing protein n=1 Tax=Gongylonema pulchrum TaxID=637853 RepID=A0A183EGX2_9BILA|nr:unnamed protein product [Gongylonema pulchrum]
MGCVLGTAADEDRQSLQVQRAAEEAPSHSRRSEGKKEAAREKEDSKMEEGEVSSSPPSSSRVETTVSHRRVSAAVPFFTFKFHRT